jgi:hypothetical protein
MNSVVRAVVAVCLLVVASIVARAAPEPDAPAQDTEPLVDHHVHIFSGESSKVLDAICKALGNEACPRQVAQLAAEFEAAGKAHLAIVMHMQTRSPDYGAEDARIFRHLRTSSKFTATPTPMIRAPRPIRFMGNSLKPSKATLKSSASNVSWVRNSAADVLAWRSPRPGGLTSADRGTILSRAWWIQDHSCGTLRTFGGI